MSDEVMYILGAIALLGYWSIRGFIGMFQRYNAILVVLYLVVLFPIAFIHMFFLGMFGDSKKEREEKEIKKEAEKQAAIEAEKEKQKN